MYLKNIYENRKVTEENISESELLQRLKRKVNELPGGAMKWKSLVDTMDHLIDEEIDERERDFLSFGSLAGERARGDHDKVGKIWRYGDEAWTWGRTWSEMKVREQQQAEEMIKKSLGVLLMWRMAVYAKNQEIVVGFYIQPTDQLNWKGETINRTFYFIRDGIT